MKFKVKVAENYIISAPRIDNSALDVCVHYVTRTLHFASSTRVGHSDTYFRLKTCKNVKLLPSPTLEHLSMLDNFSRVQVTQVANRCYKQALTPFITSQALN